MKFVLGWNRCSMMSYRTQRLLPFPPTVLSTLVFRACACCLIVSKCLAQPQTLDLLLRQEKGEKDQETFSYHGDIFSEVHCQTSPSGLLARTVPHVYL